jgi:hypothetical protein
MESTTELSSLFVLWQGKAMVGEASLFKLYIAAVFRET